MWDLTQTMILQVILKIVRIHTFIKFFLTFLFTLIITRTHENNTILRLFQNVGSHTKKPMISSWI